MAFRKHICQRRRGFSRMAEAAHESEWSNIVTSIENHLTEPGKALFPALKLLLNMRTEQNRSLMDQIADLKQHKETETRSLMDQIADLKQHKQTETKLVKQHKQTETKLLIDQVAILKKHISLLTESKVRAELDVLKIQGLNNTLGLFEKMQEQLATTCKKGSKGTSLWEDILTVHASLGASIERHTNVPASNVQAVYVYHIYTMLSQHVHAGKELADLQANTSGTILFQRGPMSPQQVAIFECVGAAAGFDIAEDPHTRPR